MTAIDMTGASDAEFESRIAPFEADDVPRELADELGRLAMRGGYGLGVLASERLAEALLPTMQRLIADAEKRAAAAALRDAADWIWDDEPQLAGVSVELYARADALDPT